MSETYISIDELMDRIHRNPDVKNIDKSTKMLSSLAEKQDITKRPRQHIITKKKNIKETFIGDLIDVCVS